MLLRASLFILSFSCLVCTQVYATEPNKQIFVGIVIKNDDALLPYFFKSLDNLTYNKNDLTVQLAICNETPKVHKLVQKWMVANENRFKKISQYVGKKLDRTPQSETDYVSVEARSTIAEMKNQFLKEAQEEKSDLCLIVESDIFLQPCTLKTLVEKDKPVIVPLLRPLPESGTLFRNFFVEATPSGHYKDSDEYLPILKRTKLGTFKVACAHGAYLIQSQYLDDLHFTDEYNDWDFLAFERSAQQNNVDIFICNEREFGRFLSCPCTTLEEQKNFSVIGTDIVITPFLLKTLFKQQYAQDAALQKQIKNFPFDQYSIYRVENRDLYYVDEKFDYIKSNFIKNGKMWEPEIHEVLKTYTRPGSVAIDVGGHIGTHTLGLSRFVGPTGTVHVFEPQDKLFPELVINMHINGCKNIIFHHQALGKERTWIELSHPDERNEGATKIGSSGEKVEMTTLDSLKLDNVSIIKIDVEGYESEVLAGAKETIARNKPVMVIEIFSGPKRNETIKTIQDMGYTYQKINEGSDFLFVPQT